ncbi:MAG: hypothetical protein R6U20_01245, partial [Longimonas sp.]
PAPVGTASSPRPRVAPSGDARGRRTAGEPEGRASVPDGEGASAARERHLMAPRAAAAMTRCRRGLERGGAVQHGVLISGASTGIGRACALELAATGLVPPEADCTPEPFSVDARLTTYGVGTALRLTAPGATVQPKLYFLITSPSVDVSINAENSDRTLNPIDPGSTNLGIALGGEVHYPITDIIALSAQIGLQRPKFGTCADDGFDPFCQTRTLVQGALGMQFRIPGSIPE